MKKLLSTCLVTGLLLLNTTSIASTISQAKVHFNSIAQADISKLMGQYEADSRLDWIGGPLDGSYSGEELRTVWSKFTKALGNMNVEILDISEDTNAKGTTITAKVLFKGKKTIPVRYVLVYRDNRIINEIWQISPAMIKK